MNDGTIAGQIQSQRKSLFQGTWRSMHKNKMTITEGISLKQENPSLELRNTQESQWEIQSENQKEFQKSKKFQIISGKLSTYIEIESHHNREETKYTLCTLFKQYELGELGTTKL